MVRSWFSLCGLVCCVLLGPATTRAAPPPPFWSGLEPGAYGVGFRSLWSLDRGRTYARPESGLDGSGKVPRPVLVNLWYPAQPADGRPSRHGQYLDITPTDGRYTRLANDLASYTRAVISEETFGAPPEELDAAARGRLNALLATTTGAVRDAEPARGQFPLVLYHAGYGSSFEDNAVLCEYLASHGYIVAGSAFLEGSGESFNIDAGHDSEADLRHLVRVASDLLPADWERIGMVGHSGGAHTAIRFLCRPSTPVDAAVLLDTTQDYHSFSDGRWDDFVPLALDHAADLDIPLLFAARQHALFRLGDRLTASSRLYLTFRTIHHNAFISQGVIAEEWAGSPDAGAMREEYNELCRAVLLFFDATLRGSAQAQGALEARWAGSAPGVSAVHAEFAAPGEGPPRYDAASGLPPTPRQMARLLDEGPATRAGELLRSLADHPRTAPFKDPEFAVSVLVQLVLEDRADEARALLDDLPRDRGEILRLLRSFESFYRRVSADQAADRFARVVAALQSAQAAPPP